MIQDYDKDCDMMFVHWGKNKTRHSREFKNINIILDFDKEDNIVGLEFENFMEAVKKSDKELDKIFGKTKENEVSE